MIKFKPKHKGFLLGFLWALVIILSDGGPMSYAASAVAGLALGGIED